MNTDTKPLNFVFQGHCKKKILECLDMLLDDTGIHRGDAFREYDNWNDEEVMLMATAIMEFCIGRSKIEAILYMNVNGVDLNVKYRSRIEEQIMEYLTYLNEKEETLPKGSVSNEIASSECIPSKDAN